MQTAGMLMLMIAVPISDGDNPDGDGYCCQGELKSKESCGTITIYVGDVGIGGRNREKQEEEMKNPDGGPVGYVGCGANSMNT